MIGKEILGVLKAYDSSELRIGVLGSHSALEVAYGAKQEGFETVVVCERGREKTYTKYFRNLFDHVLLLEKFRDVVEEENLERLRELNVIFVPHRSFSVYLGYDAIENEFRVPIFGNRFMLRIEERGAPKDQYYLLKKAGIRVPKVFKAPEEIDRAVIVKAQEKRRRAERAFFIATSLQDFKRKAEERIKKGILDPEDLEKSVIEEYVIGAKFNANFFYSPLDEELELLGFDRRIQTDLNGFLDLPAEQQLELKLVTQNIEIGHLGVTMRESQLEKVFEAGERFVEVSKREYPPGIIGPFALQGVVTKELEFCVFDVSPRVPGCPCVEPTSPYAKYKHGRPMGPGQRIALELKKAIATEELEKVVT